MSKTDNSDVLDAIESSTNIIKIMSNKVDNIDRTSATIFSTTKNTERLINMWGWRISTLLFAVLGFFIGHSYL